MEVQNYISSLTLAKVFTENIKGLRLGTKVSDSDGRAANDLARKTITIVFAETCHFTEHLGVADL